MSPRLLPLIIVLILCASCGDSPQREIRLDGERTIHLVRNQAGDLIEMVSYRGAVQDGPYLKFYIGTSTVHQMYQYRNGAIVGDPVNFDPQGRILPTAPDPQP